VTVFEKDGIELIKKYVKQDDAFIYADPPYLSQGDDLYLDTLKWEDHKRLAALLRNGGGWLLTYDADKRITTELYPNMRCAEFQTSHTAAVQHVGKEYAVFSPSLRVTSLDGLGSGPAAFV
jgi:DNA adenine methylase